MTDSNIGRILSRRYRLVEMLGQGSMGRVYGAKDMVLGDVSVAVKFLSQTLLNKKMRERFEREAKTCAQLGEKSAHIVRVRDYGVDDENEVPYYVMEYLRGQNLNELINREPLNISQFFNLSLQICRGLQCAHQGILIDGERYPIVHRDIKPSNILVTQDDKHQALIKILDFGIAKTLEVDGGQTNCFMGTLAYSSPEQMEGRELDGRSDIYSLGVMMFQMLTNKMPLHADTHTFGGWYKAHCFQAPRSLSANAKVQVPKVLEDLVMGCLAKAPEDRPQTVEEVIKALEPLEVRYRAGLGYADRIKKILRDRPPEPLPSAEPPSSLTTITTICRLQTWPDDKPKAEIVFPKLIPTSKGSVPTLWVMLPQDEIEKRLICTRYNTFLFIPIPHPVLLWLTVIYNRQHGPRWLPCYLDLKTSLGQEISRLISQHGQYRILFFTHEGLHRCISVLTSTVPAAQCKNLQEWASLAQITPASGQSAMSKDLLRNELEKLKPRILLKLESFYGEEGIDLSD